MSTHSREPIGHQWPPIEADQPARWLSERLGRLSVDTIPSALVPLLAAAAAELAQKSNIEWRVGTDPLGMSLVRAISRVAIARPELGGTYVAQLSCALDELPMAGGENQP